MFEFEKYKLVYGHLLRTFGKSRYVQISYVLQIVGRVCKLIFLPIAVSLIIARLSVRDFDGASDAVFLFVAFSLTLGILTPLIKYIGMRGENKVYSESAAEYFSRLVHTDLEYFFSHMSGYITTAMRHYLDGSIMLVRDLRDRYISTILSILFPIVVMFWVDPVLGSVALALSIVQATYLIWASRAIEPFRTRSRELYKKNSGKIADAISNIVAVRSSGKEEMYSLRTKEGMADEAKIFTQRFGVQSKLIAIREFITVFFFMALLWLVVQRMNAGHIEITAAVLVVTYAGTILTAIYSLSEDLDAHDDIVDKIVPAFEVLHRENSIKDPINPKIFDKVSGEIELKNVSFNYHKKRSENKVFDNFSLRIPAGQKVGVVGLSGAGKSTLTKLLLRFEDVDSGSVLVDGVDIREVKQSDLRKNIAYVAQEPILFHSSIRENVLLAHPKASKKEMKQALESAHAWQFVKTLPKGLEAIVGERGVKLSGGQKQRIAIARAVLQNAPIIILDEATSALDSESEQIIKNSFAQVLKGRTAIVIAHRLSTLSDMDRIIVIENGKVIEDGSHKQLLGMKGVYATMWNRQLMHED